MKLVADGEFLDVAKLRVEFCDGGARRVIPAYAAILGEARTPGPLDDLILKQPGAALVDAIGFGIFLQQSLKLSHAAVKTGLCERRRQMPDCDRAEPPLGVHSLAWIVDDEGIDDRDRAENRLGEARWRERKRLSGQPFERAVRPEVDHGVDALALPEPGIERDIAVPWRAGDVMVALLAVRRGAAVGLEKNADVSGSQAGKAEAPTREAGIVFRRAPGFRQQFLDGVRQHGEESAVVFERDFYNVATPHPVPLPRKLALASLPLNVVCIRKRMQMGEGVWPQPLQRRPLSRGERDRVRGCVLARLAKPAQIRSGPILAANIVSLLAEQAQDFADAFEGIQSNGVTVSTGARRVIRKHNRKFPRAARPLGKARPGRGKLRNVGDAVGGRLVPRFRMLEQRIGDGVSLERDRAREDAPLHFRQDDIHGEVGRAEPARRGLPRLVSGARERHLQDRNPGGVKHRGAIVAKRRKGRGVYDD